LRRQSVALKVRKSRASVRRVFVRERTVIPPNTEQNVPVKLVYSSLRTPKADWLVKPRNVANNVFMARELLPGENKCAAVRVMNLSDKPFLMRSGNNMGCAE